MQQPFRLLLIAGFLIQGLCRPPFIEETELFAGIHPLHLRIAGVIIFTLGSIQYARFKGRLWTWGLFGIILPFFLIVVFIPSRRATEE